MSADFTLVVSVGTLEHPFDRLTEWLGAWADTNREARVIVQHGTTRPMFGAENHLMLPIDELMELYATADAIVLQGGAGGVMDTRRAGRIPIVVPRDPAYDEIVDDHQVVFSRQLDRLGLVHRAVTSGELSKLLDGVRSGTVGTHAVDLTPTPGAANASRLLSVMPRKKSRLERLQMCGVTARTLLRRRR